MRARTFPCPAISIAAVLVGFTTYAQAGPPLVSHLIEIGQAKSLPWIDCNQKGSRGYDPKSLTRDTPADSNPPVLVRRETLRRATIDARYDPHTMEKRVDGYTWVKKAISLRGQDPEMEFAAALITLKGPESGHRDHARKAMAGATNDPLLAQNLASEFRHETVSKLLTNAPAGGSEQ